MVEVSNDTPPEEYTPPDIDMTTALPPEYRDAEFFKDKSFTDVITEHANLQKKLGERPAGIPQEDASDDVWGKFIGSLRPKDLNSYEFPETEFSKANPRTPGFEQAVREIAAEVGIPKRQFATFASKIDSYLASSQENYQAQTKEQQEAKDNEFEALLDKTYKGEKQAVLDRTKKLMAEAVPENMREKFNESMKGISNEQLFALTTVLDGVYKKYMAEDTPPGEDPGSGTSDPGQLKAEAEKIMVSDAYKNFRNPGHDEAKRKVQELFQQIAGLAPLEKS